MASVFSDPNNHAPVVTPADDWCDAAETANAAATLPTRLPPMPRQVRNREIVARRIEVPTPARPLGLSPREALGLDFEVQDLGSEVIRLEPPPPTLPAPARPTAVPALLAPAPSYRPSGNNRRLRTLRLRWLGGALLTALVIAGVIVFKARAAQRASTVVSPDVANLMVKGGGDRPESTHAGSVAKSAASPRNLPSVPGNS